MGLVACWLGCLFFWRSIRRPALGQRNVDHFLIVGIDLLPGHIVGAVAAKLPMEQVVKALLPFFGALLLVLIAVTYIPALSLWLPSLLLN